MSAPFSQGSDLDNTAGMASSHPAPAGTTVPSGLPPDGPTLLTTDNMANLTVATGVGCPTRSRRFLRRYFALRQRLAEESVTLKHVSDEQMLADFLTNGKWIPLAKFRASITIHTYATKYKFFERSVAE